MRHLLVDGHNVLLRGRSMPRLAAGDHARWRETLILAVRAYGLRKGFTCSVAFDGTREHEGPWESTRFQGVKVAYSRGGSEADDLLIEWVRDLEGEEVWLVTSDRALAARARALGARVLPAETLHEARDPGVASRDVPRGPSRKGPPGEPSTPETIEDWLRIFSEAKQGTRPIPPSSPAGPSRTRPARPLGDPRPSSPAGNSTRGAPNHERDESRRAREEARRRARERYERKKRRRNDPRRRRGGGRA